jgi:hypothetical protein
LFSNQSAIPAGITSITHLYQLMVKDAELARAANRSTKLVPAAA